MAPQYGRVSYMRTKLPIPKPRTTLYGDPDDDCTGNVWECKCSPCTDAREVLYADLNDDLDFEAPEDGEPW